MRLVQPYIHYQLRRGYDFPPVKSGSSTFTSSVADIRMAHYHMRWDRLAQADVAFDHSAARVDASERIRLISYSEDARKRVYMHGFPDEPINADLRATLGHAIITKEYYLAGSRKPDLEKIAALLAFDTAAYYRHMEDLSFPRMEIAARTVRRVVHPYLGQFAYEYLVQARELPDFAQRMREFRATILGMNARLNEFTEERQDLCRNASPVDFAAAYMSSTDVLMQYLPVEARDELLRWRAGDAQKLQERLHREKTFAHHDATSTLNLSVENGELICIDNDRVVEERVPEVFQRAILWFDPGWCDLASFDERLHSLGEDGAPAALAYTISRVARAFAGRLRATQASYREPVLDRFRKHAELLTGFSAVLGDAYRSTRALAEIDVASLCTAFSEMQDERRS